MLLAYDLGTGGNKAALYQNDGKLLASAFAPYSTLYPQRGWHEQRPQDWVEAIVLSTRLLLEQSKANPNEIESLAVSGHSLGCVPIGLGGELLLDSTPIWSDSRATVQANDFFRKYSYGDWYNKTGAGFPPGLYTLFKLLWYKESLPEMFSAMARCIGTKDYVNYWLTGQLATDYSYASGSGAYSLLEKRYDEQIIERSGVPYSIFPQLVPSTEILGTLTPEASQRLGLPAHVKVAAGGVDNSCMALGAKAFRNGRSYASLGSSSWIAVSSDKPLLDDTYLPYVFAHVVPGQFASATAVFSTGTTLKWIRDVMCQDLLAKAESTGQNAYALMMEEAAERSVPGANGLLLNPNFGGGSSLEPSPNMRGGLLGVDLGHTRADVIRAALEGIALNLRKAQDVLERLLASDVTNQPEPTESKVPILLVGGGAISPIWRQIYADCFNRPIEKTNIGQEAAALGAAALAAVGAGVWGNFDPIDLIHKSEEIRQPIPENARLYEGILPRFLKTAEMLSELASFSA